MGNAPSVSISVTAGNNLPATPYLNHALITFAPLDATFGTNVLASTQDWVFGGRVLELSADTWQQRLESLGADEDEPIWTAMDAFWNAQSQPDAQGFRAPVVRPDVVYAGMRVNAVASENDFEFTTNTAGTVTIEVNPARFLYAGNTPAGYLARVQVASDGVLTVTQLATAAAAALNAIPDFAAVATASAALGVVSVTTDRPGYPLIIFVRSTPGGPTMTQEITTSNIDGNYALDLDDMQAAAEFGPDVDPPRRRWYWITDLQGDDYVNNEGSTWVEDQGDPASFTPIRDYQFDQWSTTGARDIEFGGATVGNFDPTATASAFLVGKAANANTGWTRSGVDDHDRYEFVVPALYGRTIGYLPGQISFTSKALYGGTAAARMSPRDFGDDEVLSISNYGNWYSAEGPALQGSQKWGYRSNGRYADEQWTVDYVRYQITVDLLAWMQLKNIVTYTDADIAAGKAIIKSAIAKIPAVIPASIGVVSLSRDQVNPANIVARIYYDYSGTGRAAGVINRIGTPSQPIPIFISTI